MSHITLPRAVVWQLKHTLEGWANHGLWAWPESALQTCKQNTEEALAALDTALAEAEQKPEPATEKQVTELCKAKGLTGKWSCLDYYYGWRDAERFHGIRKEDGK